MLPHMSPKQLAAETAMQFVRDDQVIGLGTGSTADFFLVALARALGDGRLRGIRGIPTSRQSEQRALELGIPLTSLVACPQPDLTVDGADEIDPQVNLIKGLGGALLREKIVAQASRRMVVIADATKTVSQLGTKGPLPVEVIPFAYETHEPFLRALGAEPALRRNADGSPFLTDNGNYIYHCKFAAIGSPADLQAKLKSRAGIVETGLFLHIADTAVVADDNAVKMITRPAR